MSNHLRGDRAAGAELGRNNKSVNSRATTLAASRSAWVCGLEPVGAINPSAIMAGDGTATGRCCSSPSSDATDWTAGGGTNAGAASGRGEWQSRTNRLAWSACFSRRPVSWFSFSSAALSSAFACAFQLVPPPVEPSRCAVSVAQSAAAPLPFAANAAPPSQRLDRQNKTCVKQTQGASPPQCSV